MKYVTKDRIENKSVLVQKWSSAELADIITWYKT